MTAPRRIAPGQTWLITRRTTRRHFLLRPDSDGKLQQIYWYATAVIAERFGIELHAVQVLSTHMHEVLTDVRGMLPAFLRERNRLLANAIKCHRGWPEEVFQRAPTHCAELSGPTSILNAIAYTVANCVRAGLVRDPREWPGVRVLAEDVGRASFTAERPSAYFDPHNPRWPKRATISIAVPAALTAAFGARAIEKIASSVHSALLKAQEEARRAGRRWWARTRILSAAFSARSRSFEPFGSAASNTSHSPAERDERSSRRRYLADYREALTRLRDGDPNPRFPGGAWRWPGELLTPKAARAAQTPRELAQELNVSELLEDKKATPRRKAGACLVAGGGARPPPSVCDR